MATRAYNIEYGPKVLSMDRMARFAFPQRYKEYAKLRGKAHAGGPFSRTRWGNVSGTRQEVSIIEHAANQLLLWLGKKTQAVDGDGNVILTAEQKQWALEAGMLNLDEVDPEASIAGSSTGAIVRRQRKENADDLTKNELIVLGFNEKGICKVHGGPVKGFYSVNRGKPFRTRPEQLHIPSKNALADAGQSVNKEHIYYGCHICNKVMGDGLGLMLIDEARPIILNELASTRRPLPLRGRDRSDDRTGSCNEDNLLT